MHNFLLNKVLLFDPLNYQANLTKLRFLIRLRTITLVIQILCVFPGLHFHYLSNENLGKYLGLIFLASTYNILMSLRLSSESKPSDFCLFVSMIVDLASLSLLLYWAGAWNNPFMSMYFFHACLGAMMLPGMLSVLFFFTLAGFMFFCFTNTCNPGLRYWLVSIPREFIFWCELFIAFIIWLLSFWLAFVLKSLQNNLDRLHQKHSRFERLRAVGALAAGFSHQLASPLNNIKMRVDRFKRLNPDLFEDRDLKSLMNSVSQCDQVFKDFFSERVPPSQDLLKLTPIGDFLGQVVGSWQHDNPNTLVNIRKLGRVMPAIAIPQLAMARSLMDLLDNAQNAQAHCSQAKVDIILECQESELVIQIKDFGHGVSARVIDRLGEPFLSEDQNGTGLGLFTAVGLVESLGGMLKLDNLKTCGAVVQIFLPLEHTEFGCSSPDE